MKKVLGFILAFMVLGFSMIPCADGASGNGAAYEIVKTAPQDQGEDHEDACSPFCICSCCAGFSVVTKLPASPLISIPFQPVHSTYIPEQLYSIARPIWQPPRLV